MIIYKNNKMTIAGRQVAFIENIFKQDISVLKPECVDKEVKSITDFVMKPHLQIKYKVARTRNGENCNREYDEPFETIEAREEFIKKFELEMAEMRAKEIKRRELKYARQRALALKLYKKEK